MPPDLDSITSWTQLAINFTVLAAALIAFWNFMIAPLQKQIKSDGSSIKEALATERNSRERADAHRDERTREITNIMNAAIGRVEMLERRMERSEDDRSSLHTDYDELRTLHQA
jgi:hypothetical protein